MTDVFHRRRFVLMVKRLFTLCAFIVGLLALLGTVAFGSPSAALGRLSSASIPKITLPNDGATSPTTACPTTGEATVVRIVDGDSYWATTGPGCVAFEVRMIGIDAAEIDGHTQKGAYCPDDALGEQAKALLGQLLPPGTVVALTKDKTDRSYNRRLRYTDLTDGTDVHIPMIESGLVRAVQIGRDKARWPTYQAAGEASRAAGGAIWTCALKGGR